MIRTHNAPVANSLPYLVMRSSAKIDQEAQATTADTNASVRELLQFERLLAELSTGFINLPANRIDAAIEDGLRRIVTNLAIDRSTLTSISSTTGLIEISHSYAVDKSDLVPRLVAQESFPWMYAMVRAGRAVAFSRVDDLPAEANVDKVTLRRIGLKSHVSIPLIVAGELEGTLGFACLRRERIWPDELLGRLRLLGEIFANALTRKRVQEELDLALGFERLLADVSASLLAKQSLDIGRFMPDALQTIGEFLGVDRVVLWRFARDTKRLYPLHYWFATGVPIPDFKAVDLRWMSERVLGGEVVRLNTLAELPPEASSDQRVLDELGILSLLVVPLHIDGSAAGALSLAMPSAGPSRVDTLIPRVRLIGEALLNVLEQHRKSRLLEEAQTETAQFRDRLAHLVRVHTVGEMSAALAHEINQPLGAVENYALAARRRVVEASPDLAKVVELLDKAISQAARAGDVVTRMRSLVKRHDLEPVQIDLERAVKTCVAMVKMDCELRDVHIEVKATARLPVVVADEIHLQQVILNLLRNSIEAVEHQQSLVSREIEVEMGLREPNTAFVSVSDRGRGIADGDLERVFESFYTTKPGGLGIGLAICRKLIEAHGGALWASHNPGGGAVFMFTLPVSVS